MLKKLNKKLKNNITTNLVKQRYITNNDEWCMDETFLSTKYALAIIINLKTRCIVGYSLKRIVPENQNKVITNNNVSYHVGLNSDDILDLYINVCEAYGYPILIHSDNNPTYMSDNIKQYLKDNNIKYSHTGADKHNNQVSESVNSRIKSNILLSIHKEDRKNYKNFRLGWPDKYKGIRAQKRVENGEFREMFFNSDFFKNEVNVSEHLEKAIKEYNYKTPSDFETKYTRYEMEQLNKKIIPIEDEKSERKAFESKLILKQNNHGYVLSETLDNSIKNLTNIDLLQKQKYSEEVKVYQTPTPLEEKLNQLYFNAPESQKTTIETILLTYNEQISLSQTIQETNNTLMNKVKTIQKENQAQSEIIKTLNEYISNIKELEDEKLKKREKRKNRKRRDQTQPFTEDHYKIALEYLNTPDYSEYQYTTKLRIKVILAIFICTGLRISEVRLIKVSQVLSLIRKNYIAIDRLKRGPANKKAFLKKSGVAIIQKAAPDIVELLKISDIHIPDKALDNYFNTSYDELYLFSAPSNKGKKPYARPYFTDSFNKIIRSVPHFIENDLKFSSHSCRHGFLAQLWRDTQDIKFVQEAIGHTHIGSTDQYIKVVADDEIKERMDAL